MIMITGASGCVGSQLRGLLSDVWAPTRQELDLNRPDKVMDAVLSAEPDLIFHLAAMTDVDACQRRKDEAARINWLSTRAIAHAAARLDAVLVYLSTDYVFPTGGPFREYHQPDPVNFYGLSKLMGEREALRWRKSYVIRTSWVFGPGGKGFLSRFLDEASNNGRLLAVADQVSKPTYAPELAGLLAGLVDARLPFGLYHLAGETEATYFEFARLGVELAGLEAEVVPVSSDDLNRPAPRPGRSSLDSWTWKTLAGSSLSGWQKTLEEFVSWWST